MPIVRLGYRTPYRGSGLTILPIDYEEYATTIDAGENLVRTMPERSAGFRSRAMWSSSNHNHAVRNLSGYVV